MNKKKIMIVAIALVLFLIPVAAFADESLSAKAYSAIASIGTKGKSLSGEKIVCMGDSITEGVGGIKIDENDYISYTDYLAQLSGAEVINLGIGGTTIGDYWDENAMILRLDTIPRDATTILFWGGANDFFTGAKNRDAYINDTNTVFNYLKENFPNSKIYIVTTYENKMEDWETFADNDFAFYMNYQKELADKYGFKVIDFYYNDVFDQTNEENKEFFYDDIHPNDLGNKFLAKYLFLKLTQDA